MATCRNLCDPLAVLRLLQRHAKLHHLQAGNMAGDPNITKVIHCQTLADGHRTGAGPGDPGTDLNAVPSTIVFINIRWNASRLPDTGEIVVFRH